MLSFYHLSSHEHIKIISTTFLYENRAFSPSLSQTYEISHFHILNSSVENFNYLMLQKNILKLWKDLYIQS